jgi:hypothetical protein
LQESISTTQIGTSGHNAASSSQVVTETVNALPSGGAGGGNTGSGGGGAFAGLELCGMLLLCLWRAFVGRQGGLYQRKTAYQDTPSRKERDAARVY